MVCNDLNEMQTLYSDRKMTDVAENTTCQERFFLINHLSSNYMTILMRTLEPELQVSMCVCVCMSKSFNPMQIFRMFRFPDWINLINPGLLHILFTY